MAASTTPCTKICIINASSGLCEGCGRTLTEIANWGALNASQRLAIMAVLPGRMAQTKSFAEAQANTDDKPVQKN